jgi:S-adenosylmethionine decarboxylase proenzyme
MKSSGIHLMAEFWYCDPELLNDPKFISKSLMEAAEASGATVLKHLTHHFMPCGVTSLVLLAESHISLHSWPEKEYAAVDIYTCGSKTDPYKALEYLKVKLNVGQDQITSHIRGIQEI